MIEFDDAEADSIEVCGTLHIIGKTLELDGDSRSEHGLSGVIILTGSTSVLRFAERDHTLAAVSGSTTGVITGEDNAALITDDGMGRILTLGSDLTIEGRLKVNINLVNDGMLDSNVSGGTLDLKKGASGNGDFKATADSATVRFTTGMDYAGITGDFYVSGGGVMVIDADVITTGCLKQFAGYGAITGLGSRFLIDDEVTIRFLCDSS